MPVALGRARARSLPSYQAPPVGRATEGITATSASGADGGADLGDQRGHHVVAEIEIAPQVAIGGDVGAPEGLGHVRRKVDIARRDRPRCRRPLAP